MNYWLGGDVEGMWMRSIFKISSVFRIEKDNGVAIDLSLMFEGMDHKIKKKKKTQKRSDATNFQEF